MIGVDGRTERLVPALLVLLSATVALAGREQPSLDPRPPLIPSLPARPVQLAAPSADGCPLSFAQQLKAVDAFSKMLPVFRHPRCRNCHGGMDVLSEQHPGASQLEDAQPDPRAPMNPAQRDSVSEQKCMDCHDNIRRLNHPSGKGGWMIPPRPMFFVNEDGSDKSDEELCKLMKAQETTGEKFVSHIRDDHETIQFIEAGFAGDRALGEGLKDNGLEAEPPPGTQEELTRKAKEWVDGMGEGYESSPDCGCVKPEVELTMKSDLKGISQGQAMTAQVTSTVRLARDSSGLLYYGQAPLQHGTYTMPPLPPGCRIAFAPSGGTLDVKEARFDVPEDGPLTIQLAVQPTNSGGTMTLTCPRIPPTTMPAFISAQEWRFVHEPDRKDQHYYFDQFEVPTGGGTGRTLIGRKNVTRTVEREGVTVTATTTFELWSLPRE